LTIIIVILIITMIVAIIININIILESLFPQGTVDKIIKNE